MPVFNTAANQVLAEPVTNFYKGKALRAQIKGQELANEAAELEIGAFPDAEKRANQKLEIDAQNAAVRQQELQLRISEYVDKVGAKQAEKEADTIIGITEGAKAAEDPIAYANERMPEFISQLPDGEQKQNLMKMAEDGFQPEEMRELHAAALAVKDKVLPQEAKTNLQKELQPLVDRGVISQAQMDQIVLDKNVADTAEATGNTAKERLAEDISRMLGGDKDTATKIANGLIEMKQNPVTGMIEMTDKVTGRAWEVPIENKEQVVAAPEPGRTLWDLAEYATGPESAVKSAWNVPAAWMGLPISAKTAEARQTLRTTGQNFIRALAINPRFPVGEQNRIREEISLVPTIMDDPTLMRERMKSIASDLTLRMQQAEADGNNTSLPKDTRQSQKANANEIRNFLAIMGVPGPTAKTAAPDWVSDSHKELWPFMTDEDKKQLYPDRF